MAKSVKSLLLSILLLTLSLGQIAAQSAVYKVRNLDGANLYEKPSFYSKIIGHLYFNQKVLVLSVSGDWAYADAGQHRGYVYFSYLTQVKTYQSSYGSYYSLGSSNQHETYSSPFSSTTVYICLSPYAYAYHKNPNCRGLRRCTHTIVKTTEKQAIRKGYRPCKICY